MSGTKKEAEKVFLEAASDAGWEATKNGWPSYFLMRGDEIACVEVLGDRRQKPRKDREIVMARLAAAGIRCYVWSPSTGFGGFGGEGVDFRTTATATADTDLTRGAGGEKGTGVFDADPTQSEVTRRINEVWSHYVAVMKPRGEIAGDDERKIISKALKVASVDECKIAISSCEASDYHMKRAEYAGRQGNKYNRISQILKGRQGKNETTRERIDWWLDRAENVTVVGATVPTADAATIGAKKDEVRRGWRLKGDKSAIAKAKDAEAWLTEHGIQTLHRESDGYPIWPGSRA